jgi:hypothetical protein
MRTIEIVAALQTALLAIVALGASRGQVLTFNFCVDMEIAVRVSLRFGGQVLTFVSTWR